MKWLVSVAAVSVALAGLVNADIQCAKSGYHPKPGGGRGVGDRPPAPGGPSDLAGVDTLFVGWYTNAVNDSGYDFVHVDSEGDTLTLYLRWVVDVNPHIRVWGPTTGVNRQTNNRLWRMHRIEVQNRGETFATGEDINTQGANGSIESINLARLFETPDSICWQYTWRFSKVAVASASRDTFDVVRTVLMRRSDPYFLVKYQITRVDAKPDPVRLSWHTHPRMGNDGSRHDVGFAPGHGMVFRQRAFRASDLGYFAAMMDIGNPLAPYRDKLADGIPSFMSDSLKVDAGSGRREFLATFVCFNPRQDIVPYEFAWLDSTAEGMNSFDFDSPATLLDTTAVLDGGFRVFLARTQTVDMVPGIPMTMEYAVGRARMVGDSLPPVFPQIRWFDGSTQTCP